MERHGQAGQVAIEWLGVVLVVGLVALALTSAAPGIGSRVACEIGRQIDNGSGARSAACSPSDARARSSSPAGGRRTPFGAPNAPRRAPRSTSPRPGRLKADGLGRNPRIQRVALPAIGPAIAAALAAVRIGCSTSKAACVKAIKAACKIPLAGGLCKRVKRTGCKKLKVFCPKKQPRQPPRYPKALNKSDNVFHARTQRFLIEGGGRIKLFGNGPGGRAQQVNARVGPKVRAAFRGQPGKGAPPRAQQLKSVKPECRGLFQRGHVLPRALGGPGNDLRNLMPVTKAFNDKTAKGAEKAILEIADRTGVSVEVIPRYRTGEVVPRSVTYVARGDDGSSYRKTVRQSFRGIPRNCLTP